MAAGNESSKSLSEDSPVEEAEKERMPFDTVPNANTRIDQGEKPESPRNGTPTFGGHRDFENGSARPNPLATTRSRISTRSQQSYAGADGYTRFNEDEDPTSKERAEKGADDQDSEIIVTWDGDDDPMSPRSMGLARKWSIVFILSASSLCVYVVSSSIEHRKPALVYIGFHSFWSTPRQLLATQRVGSGLTSD